MLHKYAQRTWQDVSEGDVVPRLELNVSYRKVILNAAATWDFFPGHHDPEYARAQGQANIYINVFFFEGFVDRLVTEWGGPSSFIVRRKVSMKGSIYAGDTMYAEGEVVKVWIDEDGRHLVDLDVIVGNQEGPRCPADVTLQLPSG